MEGKQPNRETNRNILLDIYRKKYSVVDMDRFKFTLYHAPMGKKIIDIGCCFGTMFRPYDWYNVTSVDLDDYSHIVPNFIRANANNLPFDDDTFDIAVITEILEHQNTDQDSAKVLSEACRVASKVILTVPNEYIWMDGAEGRFVTFKETVELANHDMASRARKEAPFAREHHIGHGNFDHIFHHHHFDAEDIENLIKSVTDRSYYIYILPNDGATEKSIGTTAAIIYD